MWEEESSAHVHRFLWFEIDRIPRKSQNQYKTLGLFQWLSIDYERKLWFEKKFVPERVTVVSGRLFTIYHWRIRISFLQVLNVTALQDCNGNIKDSAVAKFDTGNALRCLKRRLTKGYAFSKGKFSKLKSLIDVHAFTEVQEESLKDVWWSVRIFQNILFAKESSFFAFASTKQRRNISQQAVSVTPALTLQLNTLSDERDEHWGFLIRPILTAKFFQTYKWFIGIYVNILEITIQANKRSTCGDPSIIWQTILPARTTSTSSLMGQSLVTTNAVAMSSFHHHLCDKVPHRLAYPLYKWILC